ncbi:hypothetical protein Thal_0540 [Thermocrinis albus DSM 14484]|uniref:TonB family protein n=1 Tax=Thermocrinis albus (strain DSM 14484 / JCM 11386 / HI 11/12) TaxID=638303 RepID=D3SPT7_THEAH|nr:energy transducer TonB [Thermocrinis albus]ADC89174.1 hypothetical protein Thal_0540 [Thermocrinis albus DSM 14484]
MKDAHLLEGGLYISVSFFLNLIMLTLLALYLLPVVPEQVSTPINLFLKEVPTETPPVAHKIIKGSSKAATGNPSKVQPKKEVSVLAEIEAKLRNQNPSPVSNVSEKTQVVSTSVGNITASLSGGVPHLTGGNRGVVYLPPFPKLSSEELPSTMQVKIWIDSSGRVVKVQILRRSGVPHIDRRIVEFVYGIKFEKIDADVVQTGLLTFHFRGD